MFIQHHSTLVLLLVFSTPGRILGHGHLAENTSKRQAAPIKSKRQLQPGIQKIL